MEKKIKEYLLQNKKLIINNIGVFEIVYKPSEIHPVLQTLTVPGNYVFFIEDENIKSNEFAAYVALQEKISEEQATKRINEWSEKVRKTIKKKGEYALSTLGKFFINTAGRMAFLPTLDVDISPQSFGLESFSTETLPPIIEKVKPEVVPENKNTTSSQQKETKEEIIIEKTKEKTKEMTKEETKEMEREVVMRNEEATEEVKEGSIERPKNRKPVRVLLIALCALILCSGVAVGVVYYFYPHIMQTHCGGLYQLIHEKVNPLGKTEAEATPLEEVENVLPLENTEDVQEEATTEPVEENTPIDEPQNVVPNGNFYVVLGCFEEISNADAFLLYKQSEYSNVVNLGQGETGLYMIAIGPYTRREAQKQINYNGRGWLIER
jgi:nucleoid DNA-binding protein